MAQRTIALVTCRQIPDLDADTKVLAEAIRDRGIRAVPAVWDDGNVPWETYDASIVRCCWDYPPRRDEFLAWAKTIPNLFNPAGVLRWNTDKTYLKWLGRMGIPTVPTTWIRPGDKWIAHADGEWVIKPAVSLAALDTGRYTMSRTLDAELALRHVERLQRADRTIMIQPYQASVDTDGEVSLIYISGVYSHAAVRSAVLDGPARRPARRSR